MTDAHVAAVEAFLERFAIARESVALVGLHGQTILHRPARASPGSSATAARAAAALGIDVVCDFRSADVAAGGEGAPLAPVYHAAMAAGLERPLMILNWGGVGNVTWLGPDGEIVAFDTGPANALIDDFLLRRRGRRVRRRRRARGERARRSRSARRADARSLFRPRRRRNRSTAIISPPPPPRSKRLSDADGAATLAAFTVEATAAALRQVSQAPDALAGRGRRAAEPEPHAPRSPSGCGVPVEPVEAIGFDGDAIEAQCFAYLALRSRRGLPLSLPDDDRRSDGR